MKGDERRTAIIKAVLPLFAKNGFACTTTKEIAERAGVSEALIYKHFPTKESLYAEIQSFGCRDGDVALEKIASLEPSTPSLVAIVYFLMRCLTMGRPNDPIGWEVRHRLVLNSCLEDGSYPRFLFSQHFTNCLAKLTACMEAAETAGDMVAGAPVSKKNRCLFAHHLGCMVAAMHLPDRPVVEYQVSREELLHEAVWFVLRGVGLMDRAIEKYYDPEAIKNFLSFESPEEILAESA
jgi:AcrR family transcriptional regulator